MDVPVAVASYSDEIFVFGGEELRGKFRNIIQFTKLANGGHFAALEDADRLYEDIYRFVLKVEKTKKINPKNTNKEL